MKDRPPPDECPVCGEDVPRYAKACPDCGADYESGWKEGADYYDGADIPDYGYEDAEKFDYKKWHARETGRARGPGELHPAWKWVALIVAVAFVLLMVLRK